MMKIAGRTTLVVCAAAAVLEGFDTQSMGVAAPLLALDFALSPAQKGFIFTAATIGLFMGAAVGGRAADVFGRQRMLVASLLLFGGCSLLSAIAVGPESLFLTRLLTGIGLGAAMPNFIALASEAAQPSWRVSSVTNVMAGAPFGGAIAGLIALGNLLGLGWRSIFLVGGVTPIVLALVVLRTLPKAVEADCQLAVQPAATMRVPVEPVRRVLFGSSRAPTTLSLWTGFFFTQLVLLLMLNWLPSLIVGLGFSRLQASWTSVCFNLSGALATIVLGRLHGGPHRRKWVIVTYVGMAMALTAVAAAGNNFLFVGLACGVAGAFIIGAQMILFALAPLYYSRSIRGTGVGAAVAVGRLGSAVGPLFASSLLVRGGGSATVLVGILPFVLVGGSAALALTRREQCCD